MDALNQMILFGSTLFVISILASTLSPRMGMPLLLVFLIIGMLAGEEGLGGLAYKDVESAYLLGTLALAVILFDGGLRTDSHNFRVGLRPAMLLATLGVVVTAAVTGAFAAWILGVGWINGFLIGAIVGSTDAAAVFSVLNLQGLALKTRVGATLEMESGLNDPMAIFLTVLLVDFIASGQSGWSWSMPAQFAWQWGMGGLIGWVGGRLLTRAVARLALSPGLYPLLALFGGVSIYALASSLQASGFLAVYLAGLILGNRLSRGLYNIQRFHDGIAWLAQISLFLMLGLLVSPSALWGYAPSALLVGGCLIFIARPLATLICLLPFQFAWREQLFISWVGLRGAVPIVLAMFPWLAGFENWPFYFNLAFFIVLISLVLQGWTVAPLARWLRLDVPNSNSRVQRVELGVPGQLGYEFVGYKIAESSPLLKYPSDHLPLPRTVSLLCMLRDDQPLALNLSYKLHLGDHIYFLATARDLPSLDKLLVGQGEPERLSAQAFFGEFVVTSRAKLADLALLYGFSVPDDKAHWSIARYIYSQYRHPVVGDRVSLGRIEFVVLDMKDAKLTQVGLKLH